MLDALSIRLEHARVWDFDYGYGLRWISLVVALYFFLLFMSLYQRVLVHGLHGCGFSSAKEGTVTYQATSDSVNRSRETKKEWRLMIPPTTCFLFFAWIVRWTIELFLHR